MSGDIQAVLLAGPTASGKSALALAIAERLFGTIINADSMQVYTDLAVITARPAPADQAHVPHRLYGHIDGAINYSVARWRNDVAKVLDETRQSGRLPIFVGGTGLYFKALECGLAEVPQVPDAIRNAIREQTEDIETFALHQQLATSDPLMAARLRPSDRQRILRALEVWQTTKRSLAEWQNGPYLRPLVDSSRCIRVFLSPQGHSLKDRICARFDAMMAAGALDEVERLGRRCLDPRLPVMRAHGVPGLLTALKGEIRLQEAIAAAKIDTRRYAKRQLTWFRHQMQGWDLVDPNIASPALILALKDKILST